MNARNFLSGQLYKVAQTQVSCSLAQDNTLHIKLTQAGQGMV